MRLFVFYFLKKYFEHDSFCLTLKYALTSIAPNRLLEEIPVLLTPSVVGCSH